MIFGILTPILLGIWMLTVIYQISALRRRIEKLENKNNESEDNNA